MVKRDRNNEWTRQVVLQNLRVEVQSALEPWPRLLSHHVVIVDDSMIHKSRRHDVPPAKLAPNPYSNRP